MTITAPVIYVTAIEKQLGVSKCAEIKTAFENKASEMGFIITQKKQNANLYVNINADTREAGQSHDLKNTMLNGTIRITDASNNALVYQDDLKNIKGVSTTFEKASVETYSKAYTQITEKVVSRFYRNYLK
jgi:hypothetical protein